MEARVPLCALQHLIVVDITTLLQGQATRLDANTTRTETRLLSGATTMLTGRHQCSARHRGLPLHLYALGLAIGGHVDAHDRCGWLLALLRITPLLFALRGTPTTTTPTAGRDGRSRRTRWTRWAWRTRCVGRCIKWW